MSSLIALPFRPVLNQRGEFESGAVMTVYKQGSTTLEPLFADAELTTSLSNPLTADGYGVFPPVYWNEEQEIRVLITGSNGTTLFNLDPYISTVFEAEAILDQAAAALIDATEEAANAEAAAERAAISEAVAVAATSNAPVVASEAEGISVTVDGEYFYIVNGDYVEVYLNDNEVAVLQSSVLSATAVEAALDDKADLVHTHAISDVTGLQTAIDAKSPLASPSFTGTPTSGGIEIGYRSIPRRTTSGTIVVGDRAGCVAVTANITIPASLFAASDAVSFYNDSASSVTILQGSGLTLRQAGTTNTGPRTLAARGMATVWFNSPTEAIISGPGVS